MAATGWRMVDEGWGRRAADFAALMEPSSVREYLAVHRRLELTAGERLLDMACGAGLAMELAAIHGAVILELTGMLPPGGAHRICRGFDNALMRGLRPQA